MSIVLLCHYAGLGNKLFEIACAYAFSKRLNRDLFVLPYNLKDPHNHDECNTWLLDRVQMMSCDGDESCQHNINRLKTKLNYRLIIENEQSVSSLDVQLISMVSKFDNVILHGFFQDYKYFHIFREDILSLFKCPDDVYKSIKDFNKNSYFIHVRLGDYLSHVHHFIDLSNYYDKCLSQIFEKEHEAVVHLFTNDIDELHKVYPILRKYNLNIINEQSQVHCLYMMAACEKGGICANSTFSWWGSYLNKNSNKQVFMPSKWYNDLKHLAQLNISGFYYDGVTIVDVN